MADSRGSDVEIRPGMDTHGLHRHCQWCDPRTLVRETHERVTSTSNFYGYRCPAVRGLHLGARSYLETGVSGASSHHWSGVAWHDGRFRVSLWALRGEAFLE